MNPYYNLAFEETLFEFADEETTVIFLWQNDNTIVIGRNQDVYEECNAEQFLEIGGKIARRKSGGGAVYHDLGNLCFSIISHKNNIGVCDYRRLIIRVLSLLGIQANYNGRNDLTVNGNKISGNAVYNSGEIVCQHGTILIASNVDKMNFYLTPDVKKLKRNGVKSVSARVANLSDISGNISVKDFCDAFISVWDMKPLTVNINKEIVNSKMGKYASKEWIYGGHMK